MGCHALFQGIFLSQGLNLGLLCWQADSLSSEPPGKPTTTNLSQVHSNGLFRHCDRLISAYIVLIKPQAFWCCGTQATMNVEMLMPLCLVARDWVWNESVTGAMPLAFLETLFLSNQFQNQFMMIYKPGIWFLLIICQALSHIVTLVSLRLTRRPGGVGTASVVRLSWLW